MSQGGLGGKKNTLGFCLCRTTVTYLRLRGALCTRAFGIRGHDQSRVVTDIPTWNRSVPDWGRSPRILSAKLRFGFKCNNVATACASVCVRVWGGGEVDRCHVVILATAGGVNPTIRDVHRCSDSKKRAPPQPEKKKTRTVWRT